jgi:two-component system phosphate regulon sensor histidine kinase PhoR
MKALVEEVTSSMRLQFEKQGAMPTCIVHTEGDTTLEGDRLHVVSVIFNLVDNALKYSTDNPTIAISVDRAPGRQPVQWQMTGIGVPAEYRKRIFEKFFRVPTGNVHNAKVMALD